MRGSKGVSRLGRIDAVLPDELERKFRLKVARRKGLKKGNLKKALEEAIVLWMRS